MTGSKLYLAGPITGLTWAEATEWRDEATYKLRAWGIDTLNPLRNKQSLSHELGGIPHQPALHGPQFTPTFVADRDLRDVRRCDGALIHWKNIKPSIGTAMEIVMLADRHKPFVIWGEIPSHPMVAGLTRHYEPELDAAVELAGYMFGG